MLVLAICAAGNGVCIRTVRRAVILTSLGTIPGGVRRVCISGRVHKEESVTSFPLIANADCGFLNHIYYRLGCAGCKHIFPTMRFPEMGGVGRWCRHGGCRGRCWRVLGGDGGMVAV